MRECVVAKLIPLKENVDAALDIQGTDSVENVIVVHRTGNPIQFNEARDIWYHLAIMEVDEHCPPADEAEDPLFILYTSGSTGKPKGAAYHGWLSGLRQHHLWGSVLTLKKGMTCTGVHLQMWAGLP